MTRREDSSAGSAIRRAWIAERFCSPAASAIRPAALWGALFLAVSGIAVFFLLDPVKARFFPRCPFFALTGLKCPGCGSARALHAALHCRFAEALGFNAALPAMLLVLAYCLVFPRHAQRTPFVWTVAALVFAWGIVRNALGI